jgi:hypothetical protein
VARRKLSLADWAEFGRRARAERIAVDPFFESVDWNERVEAEFDGEAVKPVMERRVLKPRRHVPSRKRRPE